MYSPIYLTVQSVHGLKETLVVGPTGLAIANPSQKAEMPAESKPSEAQKPYDPARAILPEIGRLD